MARRTGMIQGPPAQTARGMAISLILTAVALVTALGIALTYSMRAGSATSETNNQGMLASILINQAAILKNGLVITQMKSSDYIQETDLNSSANNFAEVGAFHPNDGGAEPQTPPSGSVTNSSTGWRWGGNYWNTALLIPGLPSYFYVLSLSYIQPGVCAQINKQLTGSSTVPAVTKPINLQTVSTWTNLQSDPAYAALNGYYEICFVDSAGNYQYYKTVQDDGT